MTAAPFVGGNCGSNPCWTAKPSSSPSKWKYADRALASDGVKTVDLKAGGTSKVKVGLKAQGAAAAPELHVTPRSAHRAQLWGSNGTCFGATFDASDVRRNAGGTFTARSP